MSEDYEIACIGDILALRPDQRARCCADLLMLGAIADKDSDLVKAGLTVNTSKFTWIDDGRTGKVLAVEINGVEYPIEGPTK